MVESQLKGGKVTEIEGGRKRCRNGTHRVGRRCVRNSSPRRRSPRRGRSGTRYMISSNNRANRAMMSGMRPNPWARPMGMPGAMPGMGMPMGARIGTEV